MASEVWRWAADVAVEFAVTVVTGSLAGVGEEPGQKERQGMIEQLSNTTMCVTTANYLARLCPSTGQWRCCSPPPCPGEAE